MPKSWTEKFHNGKSPAVGPSVRKAFGRPAGTLMLVPTPAQVDGYIRAIPPGEDRSLEQMSAALARASGAEVTCPMCCGMFLRICAEKAFEDFSSGQPIDAITPFWRMIPPHAPIRRKLSFGVELVDRMRATEGAPH